MSFHEQMHVVRHDFEGDNRPIVFSTFGADQFFAAGLDRPGEDGTAIFGAPDDVVAEVVDPARADRYLPHLTNIPDPYIYQGDNRLPIHPTPEGVSPLGSI